MSFGTVRATGIASGILFGVLFGAYYAIFIDPIAGIIAGIVGGLLFGLAMGFVFAWLLRRLEVHRPSRTGETVLREATGNHVANVESRGGWVYLTDQALHFKAHRLNVQRQPLTIALADIADIAPSRALGLIPNAFSVTTKAGARSKFIVNDRNGWIAAIQVARQRLRPAA